MRCALILFDASRGKLRNSSVENENSLRGGKLFPTWRRSETSEESNETSEGMIRPYVENKNSHVGI